MRNVEILVVEDHEPSRLAMKTILERRNFMVVTASTLEEALSLARKHTFSLVISDIGLPDGTGYELMPILVERFGLKGIATSGYGSDKAIAQSKAAGFAFHLIKPLNVDKLDDALAELFRAGAAERAAKEAGKDITPI